MTITASEISALNVARSVLREIERRYLFDADDTRGAGMTHEAARHAASAILNLLSTAHYWAHVPMSHAQLHNEQPELVQA
jgi:cob(I)alamin adenosyltransferase